MKGMMLLFLLVVTPLVLSQKFSFGRCGPKQSVAVANAFAWLNGDFWVYAVSPSPFFRRWNCVTFSITTVTGNTAYRVAVQGRGKITGRQKIANGRIQVNGPIGPNSVAENGLTFSFRYERKFTSATYFILDGIADNYFALYACENIGFGKLEHIIILSTSFTTPAQINSAIAAIKEKGYPAYGIKRTYIPCDAM